MPVFDIEATVKEWQTKFNIPEAEAAAMLNEAKAGFMRQDDYSRKSKAVQDEETRLAADRALVQSDYAKLQEYDAWIQQLEARIGPRETWNAETVARVESQRPQQSVSGMSPEMVQKIVNDALARQQQQFDAKLENFGQGAAAFSKFYYTANKHWEKEYGSELPEAEFQKFFTDNGHTDPRIALALFEQPYKEKKQTEDWQRKIDEAELRGMQKGRSEAGVPGDVGIAGGSWYGNVSLGNPALAVGAVADATANGGGTELTRDQQIAKFQASMDKRAAAGEFKTN